VRSSSVQLCGPVAATGTTTTFTTTGITVGVADNTTTALSAKAVGDGQAPEKPDLTRWLRARCGEKQDIHELVKKLAGVPLHYQPGTTWEYGRATDVLGGRLQTIERELRSELGARDVPNEKPPHY